MQANVIQWLKSLKQTKTWQQCQWLNGDNKTLQEQAITAIKQKFAPDYSIQTTLIENNSDWPKVAADLQHIDMFSPQKIVLLRLTGSKLQKNIADSLATIIKSASATQQIIILSDAIDKRQLKSKWLQEICSDINFVSTNQLKPQEQQQWVKLYAAERNIDIGPQISSYICSLTHANIADCKQCLDQLALLYAGTVITRNEVDLVLSQQSNFQYYELSDTLLQGNMQLLQTIVDRFKNGKHEKALLLWSIKQVVLPLHKYKHKLSTGANVNQVLAGVWSSKQGLYKAALQRLTMPALDSLLQQTYALDKCLKGANERDFWQLFTTICNALITGQVQLLETVDV